MANPRSTASVSAPTSGAPTTSARIAKFRAAIRRAVLMNREEAHLFAQIPDLLLERILDKNFNGNTELAERVMFHRYDLVAQHDKPALDARKRAIPHAKEAADKIVSALERGIPVLFLTDNDNDGSMAQAVLLEFMSVLPAEARAHVRRAYAQPIGADRGLNIENVDSFITFNNLDPNGEMLLITADIGINNRAGAEAALAKYPNLHLIVTDHHNPAGDLAVRPDARTLVVDPKVKEAATPKFFDHKNISGADTLAVVLRLTLDRLADKELSDNQTRIVSKSQRNRATANIDAIASWSNLLDYVEADVADMPIAPYAIDQALSLRALLNVSNSIGMLATLNWTERDWARLKADVPDLDIGLVRRLVGEVRGLNLYARKLLALNRVFTENTAGTEKDFYETLSDVLNDTGDSYAYHSSNPNFIAQLRPHIFRLSVIENKQLFANLTLAQMVGVYEDLRSLEQELAKHLRGLDLLNRIDGAGSTTVWPKSAHLTRIFPRKLLNKVYNDENKGFFLTLDKTGADEYSGSMRALFPVEEILPDKAAVEDDLGATVLILGHSKAAGVRIQGRPGHPVTDATIRRFNEIVSARVEALKAQEAANPLPFLSVDFGSVNLVHRINTAVRAHLANTAGLPAVLRLGATGAGDVFVTDPATDRQMSLVEKVQTNRYGYLPIKTDFHGGAFIAPVELLRQVVAKKFAPVLALSYMDDGVFIAHRVVDPKSLTNLIPFHGDRKEQDALAGLYVSEIAANPDHVVEIPRDSLANLPYFRHNKHGAREFERMESLVIDLLETTGNDVLAVIDTEGTGLGRAPKCLNIGATNLMIDHNSGQNMTAAEFATRAVRDRKGQRWLLSAADAQRVSDLVRATLAGTAPAVPNGWAVTVPNGRGGQITVTLPAQPSDAERVVNATHRGARVLVNRCLRATGVSWLVRDGDVAVTPEIANLTGITHAMVQRLGSSTDQVDKELTRYYNALSVDGRPARIIFSAHNLPYDKGITAANFGRLNRLMDHHLLCDTAKIARRAKLAYDDTPVAQVMGVTGLPPKTYFYNSPYSTFSLATFLDRAINSPGKSGVYPDISGNYLLRYNPDTEAVTFIDKRAHTEVTVEGSAEEIRAKMVSGDAPNNSVRYSVESLSRRAMVRNILLHKFNGAVAVAPEADEAPYADALAIFQEQYHFDTGLERNINAFMESPYARLGTPKDVLKKVGERFLNANRDVQALFHDGWMVAKVLDQYEPEINEGRIPADTVGQIAYTTDLPEKKVRQILDDVIAFKKAFAVPHALVHEQHNNIRQMSPDGLGLADTVYESVITAHLALQKLFNPYTQSATAAVDAIIASNMMGAMRQLSIKAAHADPVAVDSFSMRQMAGYERDRLTDQVNEAKSFLHDGGFRPKTLADGTVCGIKPIRFRLGEDVLTNGSGIYATPRRPLTADEIADAAQRLREVVLFERTLTAANLGGLTPSHRARLQDIVHANDDRMMDHRNVLTGLFSDIVWRRREKALDDLSHLLDTVALGGDGKYTADLVLEIRRDEDLLQAVDDMCVRYDDLIGEVSGRVRDRNAWTVVPVDEDDERSGMHSAATAPEAAAAVPQAPAIASSDETESDGGSAPEEAWDGQLNLAHAPDLEDVRRILRAAARAPSDEEALKMVEARRRVASKVRRKELNDENAQSAVRAPNFLPDLDMRSPIPLAFLLRVGGARALGPYLIKQDEEVALAITHGRDPGELGRPLSSSTEVQDARAARMESAPRRSDAQEGDDTDGITPPSKRRPRP